MECGRTTKCTEKEYIHGKMGENTLEIHGVGDSGACCYEFEQEKTEYEMEAYMLMREKFPNVTWHEWASPGAQMDSKAGR